MPKGVPQGFVGLGDPAAVAPRNNAPEATTVSSPSSSERKKSWRAPRKQVPMYVSVRAWKQLQYLSVDTGRSMNALLIDGLDQLFAAHGLKQTKELED